ncbi:hypothetical protein [Paracoccus yeei]|nr:hypothetical protein [Paracoccus yeei]
MANDDLKEAIESAKDDIVNKLDELLEELKNITAAIEDLRSEDNLGD